MDFDFSSVPVTALHVCQIDGRVVLLSGQGSSLVAHDSETRHILFRQRVFESEVIHGISTQNVAIQPSRTGLRVLLWAGRAAALLCLNTVKENTRDTALDSTELSVIDLCDWALFGNFLDLEPRETGQAYIVTAHNEVYKLGLDQHPVTRSSIIKCERLVSGPRCVLYSAHACLTPTGLLVAAGTVFGEVVVWSANKNDPSDAWFSRTVSVLLGHKGSIFGVCISEASLLAGEYRRVLATCSDDRSIRLWNISNEVQSMTGHKHESHPIELSDVTGFGDSENSSKSLLAMAWGHSSRIWNVRFLPTNCPNEVNRLHLISTGEDASLRLWQATANDSIDENEPSLLRLREIAYHTNHSGKNVWSSDHHFIGGKYFQYTGGADGLIVATKSSILADVKDHQRNFRAQISFDDVFHQMQVKDQSQKTDTKSAKMSLKHYAIADDGSIMATTSLGDLVHSKLENENGKMSWQMIYTIPSKSPLVLCSDKALGAVFFKAVSGHLSALSRDSGQIVSSSITIVPQATVMFIAPTEDHNPSLRRKSSILIPLAHELSLTLISVLIAGSLHLESSTQLILPPSFVPTSGCIHSKEGLLVVGSRSGSIAIYDHLVDSQLAVAVISDLHQADTITSAMFLGHVKLLEQNSARGLFVLTTGRDGNYAVHKMSRSSASDRNWTLQTVHRSSPPIGPNIEGAYLARNSACGTWQLLLYGFRSKEFVVWNETEQTEVLAVDCGGAHRSWAYSPSKDTVTGEAVCGGTFVWTKAGVCNFYRKSNEDHYTIQLGGHGREIKALAVSPVRLRGDEARSSGTSLVATGAEDTTIRFFAIETSGSCEEKQARNKRVTCLRILNKHTTGIHHLEFSPCGNYLFSSGGCEELFVWRLHTDVPVIGFGVVLECTLPKTDVDADARITSFQVGKQSRPMSDDTTGADLNFEIAATYSNGKVKIWRYSCEQRSCKGHFELREEIVEGSFCLTELHYDAKDEILLTLGTNGFINVHFPRQWDLMWKQKVHQNSVQASALVKIPGFSSKWLIITGGDDNALGLTVFCPDSASSGRSVSGFRTLLIPRAHTAAVTGLTLLSRPGKGKGSLILTFASISNDQRVKIWRVTIRAQEISKGDDEMQVVQIERVSESWTSVADTAAIEVLKTEPDNDQHPSGSAPVREQELLVVGVGMEILKVPIQS